MGTPPLSSSGGLLQSADVLVTLCWCQMQLHPSCVPTNKKATRAQSTTQLRMLQFRYVIRTGPKNTRFAQLVQFMFRPAATTHTCSADLLPARKIEGL